MRASHMPRAIRNKTVPATGWVSKWKTLANLVNSLGSFQQRTYVQIQGAIKTTYTTTAKKLNKRDDGYDQFGGNCFVPIWAVIYVRMGVRATHPGHGNMSE